MRGPSYGSSELIVPFEQGDGVSIPWLVLLQVYTLASTPANVQYDSNVRLMQYESSASNARCKVSN